MLEYLNRKEMILSRIKTGLINKKHSYKELAGMNGRLDLIKDIKYQYSLEILTSLIESTNYPILTHVKHGIDNVFYINKKKSNWYLYAINQNDIGVIETELLRNSFLSDETLIYESEKIMGGKVNMYYVIFNKKKFVGKQEYIANRWQER